MASNAFLAGLNRKNQDDSSGGGASGAFQQGLQRGQQKRQVSKSKNTLAKALQPSGLTASPVTSSALIPLKTATPSSLRKGGRVKRTGLALVHRGEYVIPAKRSRSRKSGGKRTIIKP
jgi:hypothetical protein